MPRRLPPPFAACYHRAMLSLPSLAAASLAISGGLLQNPVLLDASALAALPQSVATASFHGQPWHCTGPRLPAVLQKAGAIAEGDLKGPALAHAVVAEAADGYRVLFARGEMDPKLGNAPIIIALSCQQKSGDEAESPFRILAGGDQRGARSVRQLVHLRVVDLPK